MKFIYDYCGATVIAHTCKAGGGGSTQRGKYIVLCLLRLDYIKNASYSKVLSKK